MNSQMMSTSMNRNGKTSKLRTRRLRLFALALCTLATLIAGAALPCTAASILQSGAYVGGAATGTVNVITNNIGLDWNGLPQNNPNLVQVTSNAFATGAFYTNVNFIENPSTEYGVVWNMTNNSGRDWYSMHFTLQFAPLGNFSVTFDKTGMFPSPPNGSPYSLPYNWSDTNIDFAGGPISGSGGTATFNLPLDVNGNCCHGNFIIWATPDYVGSTPEPSSLGLFGSGVLGVGALLRRYWRG